jgi:hypothetical protein
MIIGRYSPPITFRFGSRDPYHDVARDKIAVSEGNRNFDLDSYLADIMNLSDGVRTLL